MKNLRHEITNYFESNTKKTIEDRGITEEEARAKAIQYPGHLIRYTFGGFVVTFHLLIFISFIPRLIWRFLFTFRWILELIISIVILRVLHSFIPRLCSQMLYSHNQTRSHRTKNAQSTDDNRIQSTNTNDIHDSSNHTVCTNIGQWKEDVINVLQYIILVASKRFSKWHECINNIYCVFRLFYWCFFFNFSFNIVDFI